MRCFRERLWQDSGNAQVFLHLSYLNFGDWGVGVSNDEFGVESDSGIVADVEYDERGSFADCKNVALESRFLGNGVIERGSVNIGCCLGLTEFEQLAFEFGDFGLVAGDLFFRDAGGLVIGKFLG